MEDVDQSRKEVGPEKYIRWSYSDFRDYLLRLDQHSLLPLEQYPAEIVINGDWHDLFNRMRNQSKDGKERFSIVGFKKEKGSSHLYISEVPVIGGHQEISIELIQQEMDKAYKRGINVIGNIHSHPSGLLRIILNLANPQLAPIGGTQQGFSMPDFGSVVMTDLFFIALAETDRNLFAFKSQDTHHSSRGFPSYEDFDKYWNKQLGYNVAKVGDRHFQIPSSPRAVSVDSLDAFKMNQLLSRKHNLELYVGEPNKPLVRMDEVVNLT